MGLRFRLTLLPLAAGISLTIAACGSFRHSPKPAPTPAPQGEAKRPSPTIESSEFDRAVARGTRTRTGEPGPNYWQQYARYKIDAEFVPASSQVNGRETIQYLNNSPDTLREVWIFLNQNLFASSSPRTSAVPITGGTEILRVAAGGQALSQSDTGVAYSINGTRMHVTLPRPVLPHDSIAFDIAWAFQVPPDGAPREGTTGDVFMIAYWYPQMAVYDDVSGWQTDPYLGTGEFYMGYADYDVNLAVPQGWLIGATGELTNPNDVLSPQTRERLATARRSNVTVHVVRDWERGAGVGRATTTGFDGVITWRFQARNMRDFAWGASDKYLWDATAAVVGDRERDGRPDTTLINTFYRPEARASAWDRAADNERSSLEFLSKYLWPYPWSAMTALEGPTSCSGMEYPMLTCIGGRRDTLSLYSVQVHETAHMWFPMQVGSDERRYAWQDEGLARFTQAQAMPARFLGYDAEARSRDAYLAFARTDGEAPLMRHADLYPTGTPAYTIASYEKMATNMVALRSLIGDEAFLAAYRTYGFRWMYKHPTPYDFFNTFSSLAGRDLSWFWREWWYDTSTLDHAIGSVTTIDDSLLVHIEERGLAVKPVPLAVTRVDGRVERQIIPVDVWLAGTRRYTVTIYGASTVKTIEIDRSHVLPDIDRSNNLWTKP